MRAFRGGSTHRAERTIPSPVSHAPVVTVHLPEVTVVHDSIEARGETRSLLPTSAGFRATNIPIPQRSYFWHTLRLYCYFVIF